MRRTSFTSSELVRLLSDVADDSGGQGSAEGHTAHAKAEQPFAEQLSQWLGWTDAITLSSALSAVPDLQADLQTGVQRGPHKDVAYWTAALARARQGLLRGFTPGADFVAERSQTDSGFGPWRSHYLAQQQAMATALAPLRAHLRTALGMAAPRLARLAALDTAMDAALGARERSLLGAVPLLLERRYERLRERLRQAHAAPAVIGDAAESTEADEADEADEAAVAQALQHEMHQLLLAELDVRCQPLEGLLDALRNEVK